MLTDEPLDALPLPTEAMELIAWLRAESEATAAAAVLADWLAAVRGRVDLAGLTVPFPLRFEDCDFDAPLHVEGAKLRELTLTGCPRLPGLLGNGLRLRGDLDLSGSAVTGAHRTSASLGKRSAVWLCEARIGGRLLCLDTVIRAEGERAVQADRMRTGGPVRLLHGFVSEGELRMTGARIGGSLDMIGGRIEAPRGPALDLSDTCGASDAPITT